MFGLYFYHIEYHTSLACDPKCDVQLLNANYIGQEANKLSGGNQKNIGDHLRTYLLID